MVPGTNCVQYILIAVGGSIVIIINVFGSFQFLSKFNLENCYNFSEGTISFNKYLSLWDKQALG